MSEFVLLVREYLAQQLLLLAIIIAPKKYALAIGKAILTIKPEDIL